jgi:O-antigen/teichoic acid export membrane protein
MQKIRSVYTHVNASVLYKNSLFLVVSSATLSGFGFLFWLLAAKFYSPSQIGQATALISLTNLIASFSILGIGNTLIRYLSTSAKKNETLSLAFIITGIASVLLLIIYLIGISFFTPSLVAVLSSKVHLLLLTIGIIVATYNVLFDSVFIAFRSAKFTLMKNFLMSVGKVIFPLFFITMGGFGIVTAVAAATLSSVAMSFFFLKKYFAFSFTPSVNVSIISQTWRYSLGSYISTFVITLPTYLLPIYVLNKLGSSESAYYYVSYMIANMLFTIPFSVSNSFVAEGSFNREQKIAQLKHAAKITYMLLIPAILGILLLGKYVLLAFGKSYSSEGMVLLNILAFSSVFIGINSLLTAIMRIEARIKALVGYSIVLSIATIMLSTLLIPYKLAGIGVAFLLATIIASIYNIGVFASSTSYIKRFLFKR